MRKRGLGLGLLVSLLGGIHATPAASEGAIGRVTFVGTLAPEQQQDGSVHARLRFRLGESSCGTTEGLWTRRRTSAGWSAWEPLPPAPVAVASDPAAVVRAGGIDVFVLGVDGHIHWNRWDGAQWSGWTSPPGVEQFGSAPAVASRGDSSLDLFARGLTDTALWRNQWNGTAWSGWSRVSTVPIASDPAAVARGPSRMDVFARQFDNTMQQISWNGSQWSNWTRVSNGIFSSGSEAVAEWWRVVDRIDLFARGTDSALYTSMWNGSSWSLWAQVSPSSVAASDPGAASVQVSTTDLFVRGNDNRMYTIAWTGATVPAWTSLGDEKFSGGPAAVARGGQIHLFVRGNGRKDRWIHATSGGTSDHNLATFRNAYNTLLSAFLARSVASVQVDVPSCDETQTQTIRLDSANIGIVP